MAAFILPFHPQCKTNLALIHTFIHIPMPASGLTPGSSLGFSALPKHTLTCGPEELGINNLLIPGHPINNKY